MEQLPTPQGIGVQSCEDGQGSQEPEEDGTEHRSHDIGTEYTVPFRGTHPVVLSDDTLGGFTADTDGSTDGFSSEAEHESDRQCDQRGEEVSQFLEDQCRSCYEHLHDVRSGQGPVVDSEGQLRR